MFDRVRDTAARLVQQVLRCLFPVTLLDTHTTWLGVASGSLLQALLQSSHMYAEAKHAFQKHGVLVDGVAVDVAAMQRQKASAVEGLTKGIEGLFKKNKARWAWCAPSSCIPV